jgi:hypothetical protein
MKSIKFIVSFFCLFYLSISFSQQLTYTNRKGEPKTVTTAEIDDFFVKYKVEVGSLLKEYQGNDSSDDDKRIIHPKLLNEQLKEIFNKLIFGKSDVVNSASAFGLTIKDDKTSVSGNFNLPTNASSAPVPSFIKLGLNASGKGKIFNFYNDESWENSAEGSIGAVWKLSKASRYYKLKDHEKKDLYKRRKYFLELLASHPSEKLKYSIENYNLIEKIINLYETGDFDGVSNSHDNLLTKYSEYKKLYIASELSSSYEFLYKERELIKTFFDRIGDTKAIEKFVENKAKEFDENNVTLYGHNNMWWLDTNISFSNNGFNFTEENVTATNVEAFSKNVLGVKLKADLNWSRETKNNFFYLNGGLSYDRGSFMNSSLINGTPKVVEDSFNNVVIIDDRDRVLGTISTLKDHFETGNLYVYGAWFGTKNKNIGFNASFSHQYLITSPKGTTFSNNFSLLGGPVAKTKDGSTFGIDVGFTNAVYNTRIVNDFVVRLRVGIPFNIISNTKKI